MSETIKNKGGRPAINATPITVRMPPDQLALLDKFILGQQEPISRPEAIRLLLKDHLIGLGYSND
jgi:hypothetical protein